MFRQPPRSTRTYTLFPSTTHFRSQARFSGEVLPRAEQPRYQEGGFDQVAAVILRREGYRGAGPAMQKMRKDAVVGFDLAEKGNDTIEALQDFRAIQKAALDARQQRHDAETAAATRSEEHTSELQSLMRISYAVFCLKKTTHQT